MKDPIRRRSILSRADLLGVLATGETSAINYLANTLRLEQLNIALDNENIDHINFFTKDRIVKAMTKAFVEVESQVNLAQNLKPTAGFWLLDRREATTLEVAQEDETEFSTPVIWRERPDIAPVYYPLVSPRSLLPRLFHHLKHQRQGRAVDVDAVVRKLGRGEYLYHIPRASRRSLGRHLHVIEDRHLHLIPYWTDQGLFASLLGSFLPDYASSHDVLTEGQSAGWVLPPQNSVVVVFSDFGALSEQPTEQIAVWLRIGRELQRLGCKLIAVLPCHPDECDPRLREFFMLEPWEPLRQLEKLSKVQRREQANELLALLAPAIRLEPGLLRSVRLAVARHGYHFSASVEAAVWQHPDMLEHSSIAATFSQTARNRWLDAFAASEDEAVKQTVLDTLREWRAPLRQHVWFEEITSLDGDSRRLILPSDLVDANQYFLHLSQRYERDALESRVDSATCSWFQRMEQRLPQNSWDLPDVGTALQRIAAQVHKDEAQFHADHPIDPSKLRASQLPEQVASLYQQGESLLIGSPVEMGLVVGSPLGQIRLRRGLLYLESLPAANEGTALTPLIRQSFQFQVSADDVEIKPSPDVVGLMLRSDVETLYFKQIHKPIWAEGIGRDQYGLYADIILSDITQRFRWISPRTFLMGSSESEMQIYNDKVQHQVTIPQGFWLADSAVTQALWQVVMGSNPSDFKDNPNNPVEQVSWNDAQRFINKLNSLIPRLQVQLPNESQWEYAYSTGTHPQSSFEDVPEKVSSPNSVYDIFLAYSTKDRERLTPLLNALTKQGWSVFWSHRSIHEGENWSIKIRQAISESRCVVVVWSKHSIDSEWVMEEASIGRSRGVLCTVKIDEVDAPFGFGLRSITNFIDWNGDVNHPVFIHLSRDIQQFLGNDLVQPKEKTIPVKSLPPNSWGLYEMRGNVLEWCQDWWQRESPAWGNFDSGARRVLRGGSWLSDEEEMRYGNLPNYRSNHIGFRLALSHSEFKSGQQVDESTINSQLITNEARIRSLTMQDLSSFNQRLADVLGISYEEMQVLEDLDYEIDEEFAYNLIRFPEFDEDAFPEAKAILDKIGLDGSRSVRVEPLQYHTSDDEYIESHDDSDSHEAWTWWENIARDAVMDMLDIVEIDKENHVLRFHEKKVVDKVITNYDELLSFLSRIADDECSANAPFEGGESIFNWDSQAIAESVLMEHSRHLYNFFNQ